MQWADCCKLNGLKLPPSARPTFDRGSLAVAAAADGLGIALERSRFAEAELARGELIALDGPAFRRIERATHLICYRKTSEERAQIVVTRDRRLKEAKNSGLDPLRAVQHRTPALSCRHRGEKPKSRLFMHVRPPAHADWRQCRSKDRPNIAR